MGTRFVASLEAFAHPDYKARLLSARAEDIVYSESLFDVWWPGAPHRALRNKTVEQWEAAGRPPTGERPGEGTVIGAVTYEGERVEIPRYAAFMLTPAFEGDVEYAPMWAGESVGLVTEIKSAGQIVADIVREAEAALQNL